MTKESPDIDFNKDIEELEELAQIKAPVKYDALQRYLMEINKFPLLSREEEIELAIRYRETGDVDAAYKLVTSNLRLVVKIALEFYHQWMISLLDLIQEGNIGLMQAIKKFDPYRGVKLSHYASYWIRAYILKFIMDNWKLVKIGTTQTQRKLFFNLQKEKKRLEAQGFDPAPKRLAEAFSTTEGKVIEMEQRLGDWEPSLDQVVGDDWKETRGDFISDDKELFDKKMARSERQELFNEKLNEFKKSLDDKELEILEKRLLSEHPRTLQAIGAKYGVTKERVRQLEERLKKKIRTYIEEKIPDF
ncbi:MAG: RNA polymerase factor sigma-32 [Proteobacteria bacterium]|nr:RNA polymerase factor sigma-32 [Pseudomonadota bacterium]